MLSGGLQPIGQPARAAQQPRIVAAAAHQLQAQRQVVGACSSGRFSAGMPHSDHSVQNTGSPVLRQRRRTAGRGRREDGVVALEQFVEAVDQLRDAGQRLLVVQRA